MGSSLTKGTVRVQVRKDTASNWTSANPTLAAGEFGFETDTGLVKIGDGSNAWDDVKYIGQWELQDGDGTGVEMNTGRRITLAEGAGIDINHTDTGSPTYATTITCDLEGTELASTGEGGGTKFLREDGDGSCSWQTAGGTVYWMPQWATRWYTRYLNWYFPSTTFGAQYFNWNGTLSSTSLPSVWADAYNPCITVPKACTLTEYFAQGNFTNPATYELALMRGPAVTFGSAGDYSLSQIGATQEQVVGTGGVQYKLGQSGLSQALAAGDILIPCLRRTTTDTATYYSYEMSLHIVAEIS